MARGIARQASSSTAATTLRAATRHGSWHQRQQEFLRQVIDVEMFEDPKRSSKRAPTPAGETPEAKEAKQ